MNTGEHNKSTVKLGFLKIFVEINFYMYIHSIIKCCREWYGLYPRRRRRRRRGGIFGRVACGEGIERWDFVVKLLLLSLSLPILFSIRCFVPDCKFAFWFWEKKQPINLVYPAKLRLMSLQSRASPDRAILERMSVHQAANKTGPINLEAASINRLSILHPSFQCRHFKSYSFLSSFPFSDLARVST